jgi:hypothetical protein
MSAGGGTWKIIVEEGQVSNPTQSTVAGGKPSTTKSKVAKTEGLIGSAKGKQLARMGLVTGTAIATTGFNQYYSITGQGGQRNRMNTSLSYGAAIISIGIQAAKGNFIGAAVTTLAVGVTLGNQYVNFQRDVADSNAMAEYLRQQSGTSISSTRGDMFNFSLF